MEIWIEGENRSDLKKAVAYSLLTVGFFIGLILSTFIYYTNTLLGG